MGHASGFFSNEILIFCNCEGIELIKLSFLGFVPHSKTKLTPFEAHHGREANTIFLLRKGPLEKNTPGPSKNLEHGVAPAVEDIVLPSGVKQPKRQTPKKRLHTEIDENKKKSMRRVIESSDEDSDDDDDENERAARKATNGKAQRAT